MPRKRPEVLGLDLNRSEPAGTRLVPIWTGSEPARCALGPLASLAPNSIIVPQVDSGTAFVRHTRARSFCRC
jgi:hypothetical protein